MTFHLVAGFAEMNKVLKNIKSRKKEKMLVAMFVQWDHVPFYFVYVCTFLYFPI